MSLPEVILSIIGILIASAAAFAGIGYFKQGKNQEKLDSISLLEADVKALRGKIDELTVKVNSLQIEIEVKDKKLADTLAILQGRNPEMETFMKMLEEYTQIGKPAIQAITADIMPVVKKLDKFLDKQVL